MKSLMPAAAIAAAVLAAPAAEAAILYTVSGSFQADTDQDNANETYEWSFSFVTDDFVTSYLEVAPASCTITGTFYKCGATQAIDPFGDATRPPIADDDFIGFRADNVDDSGGGQWDYYFEGGSLQAYGVYTNDGQPNPNGPAIDPDTGEEYYFGNAGPAVLTVSPFVAAVPEPATWAMMIAGFGLIGGALRRRSEELAAA